MVYNDLYSYIMIIQHILQTYIFYLYIDFNHCMNDFKNNCIFILIIILIKNMKIILNK